MLKRTLKYMAAVFTLAIFATQAFAITDITSPLRSDFEKLARGMVELEYNHDTNYPGEVRVSVTAKGLEPYSTYTVWLAREEPATDIKGVGLEREDYAFTTDGSGTGRFIANVNENDLLYWDVLEIAHHPDGDPRNIEQAEVVLKSDLAR